MHELSLLVAAVALLLAASNAPAQTPANAGAHYSFEAIDPPDTESPYAAYAYGVNDEGDVVGYYRTPSPCNDPGNVCDIGWLKDGQGYRKIYFPNPPGYTYVTGINDSGMIVGRWGGRGVANNPGFEYDLKSGSFDQIRVPGAEATFPTSINNLGVIGGFSEAAGNSATAFSWKMAFLHESRIRAHPVLMCTV